MAKNYIKGSIREVTIGATGDTKLVASFLVSELQKIANEKGYASVVIQSRREADAFGNTHYAYENDYNPEEAKKAKEAKGPKKADLKAPTFKEQLDDDNPFA
jgi:hypothetical protein